MRREAKCLHCAKCLRDADECPSGAFEQIGRDISLDALEREVMKDDIFFRTSGGGVTLSGGEVLMQAEFATRFTATAAMGCVMRHRNCRRRASQQAVTAGEIVR